MNHSTAKNRVIKTGFFILFMALFAGCAGNYGNISPSREITDRFHAYEILPDLRYYYTGPDAYPLAIIGIHSRFSLESRFWKPVDLTSRHLRDWLNFGGRRVDNDLNIHGANLTGPAGEWIGVWYAIRDWKSWGTVRLEEENRVVVTTPDLAGESRFLDDSDRRERTDGPFSPWWLP